MSKSGATSKTLANKDGTARTMMMALDKNVSLEQVVTLVDHIGELASGSVDAARLGKEFEVHLLAIVKIAEMLGLVKTEKQNISITEFGLKIHGTSNYRGKARLLKEVVAKMEPCNTALALVSSQGSVSIARIAKTLKENGIQWNQDLETNESMIRTLLIDWATETELLRENNRGEFENFSGGEKKATTGRGARAVARREFIKSSSEARKKYREARRAAWKAYRDEVSAARTVYKEVLKEAKKA
jgi:hypothetical protein